MGGDWDLEITSGLIESQLAFNSTAQQNFNVVLRTLNSATSDNDTSNNVRYVKFSLGTSDSATYGSYLQEITVYDTDGNNVIPTLTSEENLNDGKNPAPSWLKKIDGDGSIISSGVDSTGYNHWYDGYNITNLFDRKVSNCL